MLKTLSLLSASIALTLASVPVHAELTKSDANGFVVRHKVEVSTDPQTTFKMLRSPAKWWSAEHSWTGDAANFYMDAQATGCFCELLPANEEGGARGSVEHMRIVYAKPGEMLRLHGALGPLQSEALNGALTISLEPTANGTAITMEYVVGGYMRFAVEEIAPAVDGVIGEQASRLAMALGPIVALDNPAEEENTQNSEPVE